MIQRVQLIGFMGTGKSTYGALMALSRNVPFADLDNLIEAEAGRSINELFREEGETGFRQLEKRCYLRLPGSWKGVLALGGGLPLQEGMAGHLRAGGPLLHLAPPLDWLIEWLAADDRRPLLQGLDAAQKAARIRELHALREPVYRRLATRTVELPDPAAVPQCLDLLLDAWDQIGFR